jgi:hypothetical protein
VVDSPIIDKRHNAGVRAFLVFTTRHGTTDHVSFLPGCYRVLVEVKLPTDKALPACNSAVADRMLDAVIR